MAVEPSSLTAVETFSESYDKLLVGRDIGVPQKSARSFCPLPLRERATRWCNIREWVRGSLRKKLFLRRGPLTHRNCCDTIEPSPARGEGKTSDAVRLRRAPE